MNNKFKVTIGTFDWIKGFGMICIVIGHMLSNYDLSQMSMLTPIVMLIKIVAVGLMPLYLIISGFSLKKRAIKTAIKKSAREFLIPYLWVTLSVSIIFPFFHYLTFRWWPGAMSEAIRYILAYLLGIPSYGIKIFGIELYACNLVWFLLTLFIAQNVLNLILIVSNRKIQILFVGLCVVIGYLLAVGKIWYFCMPQGLMAVGFVYLGYTIKEKRMLQKKVPEYILVILCLIASVECAFGDFNFANSVYRFGILDYIGAGCMGTVMFLGAIWTNELEDVASEKIRVVGRYTYWILCIHGIELTCIPWYVLQERIKISLIGVFAIELLLKIIIISVICYILNRISKLRYRMKLIKR